MKAWHFTNGNELRDGRPLPAVGETLKHEGRLIKCVSGLHASERIIDAIKYAPGCELHSVECGGAIINRDNENDDKLVCSERTIIFSVDMTYALMEFAENCAKRAALSAAKSVNAVDEAKESSVAASLIASSRWYGAVVRFAYVAADACADAAYYAVNDALVAAIGYKKQELKHQEETLRLWVDCLRNSGNG